MCTRPGRSAGVFLVLLLCAACVPPSAQPTPTPGNEITVEILRENALEIPPSDATMSTVGVTNWMMEVLGQDRFEGYAVAGTNNEHNLVTLFLLDQRVTGQTTFRPLLPETEADAAGFRAAFMADACGLAAGVPSSIFACKEALVGGQVQKIMIPLLTNPVEGRPQTCQTKLALCEDHLSLITLGTSGVHSTGWNYVKTYCTPEVLREVCPDVDLEEVDVARFLLEAGAWIWDYCKFHHSDAWCQQLCEAGTFRNGVWCPTPMPPEAEPTPSHGGNNPQKPKSQAMAPFEAVDDFGGGSTCALTGWIEWSEQTSYGADIHARKVCIKY